MADCHQCPFPKLVMSVPSAHAHTFETVKNLADCLIAANRQSRPIIPIVGSGISADSGFPVIASIIRYFGKLRTVIDRGVWLPGRITSGKDPLGDRKDVYKAEPWLYVQDFAWPDRFQLSEDLLIAVERTIWDDPSDAPTTMSAAVCKGIDSLLKNGEPSHMDALEALRSDLGRQVPTDNAEAALTDLLARRGGTSLSPEESALIEVLRTNIQEVRHFKKQMESDLNHRKDGSSVAWDLCGDWKRMIHAFTNFQDDQADALLTRFARDRSPNLAHRYLAFLIRRLGVPVVFTMNFDPFIEQALQEEGMTPQIFAMEHGQTLPDRALVREQLSVIKMHGSTHALLLDEKLDRPLSSEYLKRFREIVPADALFLVIGCSGNDKRLLDLIEAGRASARENGIGNDQTSVAWLHFEPEGKLAPSVKKLLRDGKFLRPRRTKNLGGTLLQLYSEIDHLHPSSKSFYLTHFEQPVLLDGTPLEVMDSKVKEAWDEPPRFLLLETIGALGRSPETYPEPSASKQLLLAGSSLPAGFNLIWVDLESVHTLSAVAGSIIDQCRKYDPAIAPCVLPLDEDDSKKVIDLAVARIARALRRSRYFVAFDGLETYTWSPTAHHGDTHSAFWLHFERKLTGLTEVVIKLKEAFIGDSRFALSVDPPRTRSPRTLTAGSPTMLNERVLTVLRGCVAALQGVAVRPAMSVNNKSCNDFFGDVDGSQLQGIRAWNAAVGGRWSLALSVLATFRRTRPLALVYQTLQPILKEEIDDFLEENQKLGVFRQIEGGGIWFFRELRDYVYAANTRETSADAIDRCLQPGPIKQHSTTIFQLLLNACTHQMAARAWYSEAFIQSHDTFALMEYLYHRLAGVRSLTKLIGLLAKNMTSVPDSAINAAMQDFKTTVEQAPDLWEAFELDPALVDSGRSMLCEALSEKHREQLHRLRRAWQRSEKYLRAQVPAEQLLRWCEQFLNNDLEHRCHRLVTGYKQAATPSGTMVEPEGRVIPLLEPELDEQKGAIGLLKCHVRDFAAKIRMDRSEYAKCREEREAELRVSERFLASAGASEKLDEPRIRLLHHEIDEFVCHLRQTQEETVDVDDLALKLGGYATELEAWKNPLERLLHETQIPGLHEVQLRRLHVLSNCYLGRVCIFSHEGFDGRTGILKGFNQIEANEAIAKGSTLARLQSQPLTSSPRSTSVNATPDGTVYLQYRAIFLTQHARWLWMDAVNNGSADAAGLLATFDRALQEFEKARAGLDANNNLTLALADLHAVEACLAHARIVLHEGSAPEVLPKLTCEQIARSRYERARGLLGRARLALAGAQRNVVWWRLFFQLTAQYHSDRLLWCLLDPTMVKAANYLGRLRKGYQSLRNGYDLHLHDNNIDLEKKLVWLPRLGCELTLSGFALGLETWSQHVSYTSGTEIDYLNAKLNWLTETAGLGTVYGNTFCQPGGAYEALLNARTRLESHADRRRRLRQAVITLAAEHSSGLDVSNIISPTSFSLKAP